MNNVFNTFDNRVNAPEPHIVALLAEIDEAKGHFRAGLRMTPQAMTNLKKSTLVTSAGASTRIEGARLDDTEVENILRGLATSHFADRDSQEVQGYLETLQHVFESYETLPLRESVVLSLHNQLLKYSVKDSSHRGVYKKKENTVGVLGPDGNVARVVFETTRAYLAPKETRELIDWTADALERNRFHPLLIIAHFVVEFLKIHPFEDGNGRLSRVLTNLLLLQFGYMVTQYVSHESIIERRKDEYYVALRTSQKTFDTKGDTIAPWLNFFLSVVREQFQDALSLLEDEQSEDMLSPKQYAVWQYLSEHTETTPSDVARETGIALGTVRQALNRLVALGKVKRIGRGRATRYVRV